MMLALWLWLAAASASPDPGCVIWLESHEHSAYGVQIKAETTLEAPVDAVLRTLEDFDHYADYMPRVKRAQRRPDGLVFTELKAPWPLRDVWFVAQVRRDPGQGGGFVMRWTMREGNIRTNVGSWAVSPLPGGATRLRYEGIVELYYRIPASILRFIQEHELPKVVQALRQRAVGKGALQCTETTLKYL